MRIKANLIISIVAVQLTVGCAASLPEQCHKLKMASYSSEIYKDFKKETDPSRKRKLLAESYSEKARNINNLELSDINLKSIQTRLVKSKEGLAKRSQGYDGSMADLNKIMKDDDDLDKDLDAACPSASK